MIQLLGVSLSPPLRDIIGEKEAKANLHWVLLTDGNDAEFGQKVISDSGKVTYFRDYSKYYLNPIDDKVFWERVNFSWDKTLLPAFNYAIVYNQYR